MDFNGISMSVLTKVMYVLTVWIHIQLAPDLSWWTLNKHLKCLMSKQNHWALSPNPFPLRHLYFLLTTLPSCPSRKLRSHPWFLSFSQLPIQSITKYCWFYLRNMSLIYWLLSIYTIPPVLGTLLSFLGYCTYSTNGPLWFTSSSPTINSPHGS